MAKYWYNGLPIQNFTYADPSDLKHWYDGVIFSALDYVTPVEWTPVEIPSVAQGHFKDLAASGRTKPDPGAGANKKSKYLLNEPYGEPLISSDMSAFTLFDFVDVPVTALFANTKELTVTSGYVGEG